MPSPYASLAQAPAHCDRVFAAVESALTAPGWAGATRQRGELRRDGSTASPAMMRHCSRPVRAVMKRVILIDARWLEPPERVLPALDALFPGGQIRFLIHRLPLPRYPLPPRAGNGQRTRLPSDGGYWRRIERDAGP